MEKFSSCNKGYGYVWRTDTGGLDISKCWKLFRGYLLRKYYFYRGHLQIMIYLELGIDLLFLFTTGIRYQYVINLSNLPDWRLPRILLAEVVT